jgi:hypothetical protein
MTNQERRVQSSLQQLTSPMLQTIEQRIATELGIKAAQVIATVQAVRSVIMGGSGIFRKPGRIN